jgi:hypothetical protein
MTAPEPPEVEAEELAAARERIANLEAGRDVEQQMLRNIAGQLIACQMKYDAALELVQEANNGRAEFKVERDAARNHLARALPVVEAARAYIDECENPAPDLLYRTQLRAALARAVSKGEQA